jgi:hypothetical protein
VPTIELVDPMRPPRSSASAFREPLRREAPCPEIRPRCISCGPTPIYEFGVVASAGYIPGPGVALDSHGNLYGITLGNLQHNSTLFELTPPATSGAAWSETTLYTFTGTADGAGPNGVLLVRGNAIIGTTIVGGSSQYGTVYELTH